MRQPFRIISSFLLILLFAFSCSNDDPEIYYRSITGTYTLLHVAKAERIEVPGGSMGTYEFITTECDRLTTLEIKPDGTLKRVEKRMDGSGNCILVVETLGEWKLLRSFYGGFQGEIKFADSERIFEATEKAYSGEQAKAITLGSGSENDDGGRLIYEYQR